MHHGGVQGYQVKDDSNESNSHMMPLPGSCFCNSRLVYLVCDACDKSDVPAKYDLFVTQTLLIFIQVMGSIMSHRTRAGVV
jgi:hypothetical protein